MFYPSYNSFIIYLIKILVDFINNVKNERVKATINTKQKCFKLTEVVIKKNTLQ